MPSPATIRTFLAFELPDEILDPVVTFGELLQERATRAGIKARFVTATQCHLTMRFFGDTTPEQCEQIQQCVKEVVAQREAPLLGVEGLGAFPSWQRPRVFWVGLQDATRALTHLFHSLDDTFHAAGLGRHDKTVFSPHITLARVKHAPARSCPKAFEGLLDRSFGACSLSHLTLFQSELTSKGAAYTPLAQWELPISP